MQCDGVFVNTCEAYDRESLLALDHWISSSLGKPLYVAGPLLPPANGGPSIIPPKSEIHVFLDTAMARYGKNSVLLVRWLMTFLTGLICSKPFQISFGTIFWPSVQDHLDLLVNVLIEKKFPFVRHP